MAGRSGLITGSVAGFAAAFLLLVLAPGASAGASKPIPRDRLIFTYNYFSEVVPAGKTRNVKAECPNGQTLLSSGVAPTSTGAGPTGIETPLFIDGFLPGNNDVRVPFRNEGSIDAEGEVQVSCIKPKGVKIDAKTVRDPVQVQAGADGTATAVCKKRGAIPGEVGFTGDGVALAGGEYFKTGGDIGYRMSFAGTSGGRGELRMLCLRGSGVKLNGKFVGNRLNVTAPVDEKTGKRTQLLVDYGSASIQHDATLSNAGAGVFVGPRGAPMPWTNPYPIVGPRPFDLEELIGRGLIDFGGIRRGSAGAGAVELFVSAFSEGDPNLAVADLAVAIMRTSTAKVVTRGQMAYDPSDFANDPATDPGGSGGGGGGGSGTGSKVSRPYEKPQDVLPNCNPGFFVDIYIDADAENPVHRFLENNNTPPCPGASHYVTIYYPGNQPPGNTDPDMGWQTHQTYRVTIESNTSGLPSPKNFGIQVDWTDPSP